MPRAVFVSARTRGSTAQPGRLTIVSIIENRNVSQRRQRRQNPFADSANRWITPNSERFPTLSGSENTAHNGHLLESDPHHDESSAYDSSRLPRTLLTDHFHRSHGNRISTERRCAKPICRPFAAHRTRVPVYLAYLSISPVSVEPPANDRSGFCV